MTGPSLSAPSRKRRPPSRPLTYPKSGNGWPPPKSGPGTGKLICKIYEDNALGKLPDARYEALDAQYAKEQDALNAEITELEKAVTGYEQSRKSAEKFIALIDKYENFDTLTNTMLNEFVEKILVHERARKGSQDTTQEVEIYFNFVAGISRPPCSRFP